jgi:hypothetical protein
VGGAAVKEPETKDWPRQHFETDGSIEDHFEGLMLYLRGQMQRFEIEPWAVNSRQHPISGAWHTDIVWHPDNVQKQYL